MGVRSAGEGAQAGAEAAQQRAEVDRAGRGGYRDRGAEVGELEAPGHAREDCGHRAQAFELGQRLDRLRVAEQAGEVVGHVAFSPVSGADGGLGLGPLAVRPDTQRRGVGSALVARGLAECVRLAQLVVVVLGDPAFYARFGFAFCEPFDAYTKDPNSVFMTRLLGPGPAVPPPVAEE